jgi:hypothetical protein
MARTNRLMRGVVLAVASLAVASSSARAQGLWFSAAGETGGNDVHLLFSEVGLVQPGLGFRPVGSLGGYWVFHEGADNAWGITPAVGVRYTSELGFTQMQVGWALRGENGTPLFGGVNEGLYTSFHTEYWGVGTYWAQGLANYNIGGNFIWSAGRLGRNFFQMANGGTVGLGAEITHQRETVSPPPGTGAFRQTQIGPVLRWTTSDVGPTLQFSGGWRETRFGFEPDDTWYLRAEFSIWPGIR